MATPDDRPHAARRLGSSGIALAGWLVGGASLAIGLALFSDGFVGNVVAEVFGVAVSVAIALSVVDRLTHRERRREWEQVATRTKRAIKHSVWNMAWEYWLTAQRDLPIDDSDLLSGLGLDQPEERVSATLDRLARSARAVLPAREEDADNDDPEFPITESPEELHEKVVGDLDYLRTVLTPRVLNLADDPRLVELLLRLEEHDEAWRGWMTTAKEWSAPDTFAWREATAVLETAAEIYAHVLEPGRVALPGDDGRHESLPH